MGRRGARSPRIASSRRVERQFQKSRIPVRALRSGQDGWLRSCKTPHSTGSTNACTSLRSFPQSHKRFLSIQLPGRYFAVPVPNLIGFSSHVLCKGEGRGVKPLETVVVSAKLASLNVGDLTGANASNASNATR